MEKAAALGPLIAEVAPQTFTIYGDLLAEPERAAQIHASTYETFTYGTQEKQKLDLYKPSSEAPVPFPGKPHPILIYFHGGGFVSGGRIAPEIPGGLVYKNVGHFFADKCGFEVVVPSYRLLQDGAKHPSGGDDVAGVLKWVNTHHAKSARDIFLLGNSAGGVNVGTWLLHQNYHNQRAAISLPDSKPTLKGVILLGTPFLNDLEGGMGPILLNLYGGPAQVKEEELTNLLLKLTNQKSDAAANLPDLIVMVSEHEPEDAIIGPSKNFYKLWTDKGGRGKFIEIPGHTHLSTPLGLGSGVDKEEAWGFDLVKSLQAISVEKR